MSNPDSFINEVKEEVRRDRLFRTFRRYGWIGLLVVLAIVSGTAYREWSSSRERALAEQTGDAIQGATEAGVDLDQRISELDQVEARYDDGGAVRDLVAAAELLKVEGRWVEARERLEAVEGNPAISVVYRDLASLKKSRILIENGQTEQALPVLERLAEQRSPYWMLATEMMALAHVEEGNHGEARMLLEDLNNQLDVPPELFRRSRDLLSTLDDNS